MSLGFRTVLFSPLVPDGSGAERVATGMAYRWRAVYVWDAGDESGGMETQWSPWLEINGTALTSDLPITPTGNGLDVEIQTRVGAATGKVETRTETVAVPAGSGTIDFYNTVGGDGEILVRLVRSSMVPVSVLLSSQEARLQAVELALASFPSGGASTVAAISNMSSDAKAMVITPNSYATMRGLLSAAPVTAPSFLTSMAAAGTSTLTNLVVTGTTSFVDGSIAQAEVASLVSNLSTLTTAAAAAQTTANAKAAIAGDLGGTGAAPVVVAVQGIAVSGTDPTAGQVLTASSGSAAAWATSTTGTVIDEINDVPGLTAALAAKRATLAFEPGEPFVVRKDITTGFWPASWTGKTAVYTSGSASAGVRPTSDATVVCIWKGADPSPAVVSSGTAGMRDNIDVRWVH